ncbi:hypothetical protein Tco_0650099 [Tanacetum coccineum]
MSLENLMKSISQTCSESDTLRWIVERVLDSRTVGVEVVASVVVGVGIGVECGGMGKNRGMNEDTVVTRASVVLSGIDERIMVSWISETGTVSGDEDWIFGISC